MTLPRILIIDDLYGRTLPDRRNRDREDLCIRLGLKDVTGDEEGKGTPENIPDTVASAVFCRGQVENDGIVENDLSRTLRAIRDGWQSYPRWAMVLLDLHFKTGPVGADGESTGRDIDRDPRHYFGMTILENIRSEFPEIPVVMFSAMNPDEVSRDYADLEAVRFLSREMATRTELVECLWNYGLLEDNRSWSADEEQDRIIGHSLPLLIALREARQQAKGNENILLLGESGTGKELLARYIHDVSPNKNGPFMILFTQGTTESIFEDKLFGHTKGAYTGATEDKKGVAELANGGTLFIDEFGDIPLTIQQKFLRLFDENIREVERQGSNKPIRLKLQIVLATHRDINSLEQSGGFRQDLIHRIRYPYRIVLPPLRERKEDIPILVKEFVKRAVRHYKAVPREVTPEAMDFLLNYPWPGNIRELQQAIEEAVRRFPDVPHLVLPHVQIKAEQFNISVSGTKTYDTVDKLTDNKETGHGEIEDIDSLIQKVEAFTFGNNYSDLHGKLPAIQQAFANFLANYLKAALLCPAIRKFSPNNPDGENNITGAIKCLTGKTKLKAPEAYDVIKKLLQFDRGVLEEKKKDPILGEVYQQAVHNRNGSSRKRKG